MNDPSPEAVPSETEGLVCSVCHGKKWKVTRTREGLAMIRRWRTCLACGHDVRTRETIETDAHPDHEIA